MKISMIAKLSAVACMAACMCAANAADTPSMTGLSARIGSFMPTNSLASDLGHNWFGFGVDYKISNLSLKVPITGTETFFGISADYYSHGSDSDIPVALTANTRQGQFLYSVGVGPDFRNSGDLTSTGVGIGEQVAVSYEFGNTPTPVFLQAKYFLSSKPQLSGFGFYLGVRF